MAEQSKAPVRKLYHSENLGSNPCSERFFWHKEGLTHSVKAVRGGIEQFFGNGQMALEMLDAGELKPSVGQPIFDSAHLSLSTTGV